MTIAFRRTAKRSRDGSKSPAPRRIGPLTEAYVKPKLSPFVVRGEPKTAEEISFLLREEAESFLYPETGQGTYHRFAHVVKNQENLEEFFMRCDVAGVVYDREAVVQANIMHDALFHIDHTCEGFRSKEEHAASYTYNRLIKLGAEEAHASKVAKIVFTTYAYSQPETTEEILMRAADLRGLAADYSEFRENTDRLWKESRIMRGYEVPFNDFARTSLAYLPLYFWRDLQLTPFAKTVEGRSIWHTQALSNCIELFAEIHGGRQAISVEACCPIDADVFDRELPETTFLILIDPDPAARESALAYAQRLYSEREAESPIFCVPGTVEGLPLPGGQCDRLVLGCSTDELEANREQITPLMREGATVVLRHNVG